MSITITKGRMFRATVSVEDDRLEQMKKAPDLAGKALQAGADYWHANILKKHFDKEAHEKYGYAKRASTTLKQKRGRPDLIMSGSMRRDLTARASFTVTGGKSPVLVLRMTARVLNFVPNMSETSDDLYVRRKGGKSYPNMKREIRVVKDVEMTAIVAVVKNELVKLFGPKA